MAVGNPQDCLLKVEAVSLDAGEHLLAVEQHQIWKYFRASPD